MRYADKLRDPRWQKMRLRVFERDGFKCVACGSTERTLHVHHKCYCAEPWESDMDDLASVCEWCHDNIENAINLVRQHPEKWGMQFLIPRAIAASGLSIHCATRLLTNYPNLQKNNLAEAAAQEKEEKRALQAADKSGAY